MRALGGQCARERHGGPARREIRLDPVAVAEVLEQRHPHPAVNRLEVVPESGSAVSDGQLDLILGRAKLHLDHTVLIPIAMHDRVRTHLRQNQLEVLERVVGQANRGRGAGECLPADGQVVGTGGKREGRKQFGDAR